jgi:hypothetical protein
MQHLCDRACAVHLMQAHWSSFITSFSALKAVEKAVPTQLQGLLLFNHAQFMSSIARHRQRRLAAHLHSATL